MNEGVIKVDLKRMMTKIMSSVGFKADPKLRQELLAAFEEDIKQVMSKYKQYEVFENESVEEDLSAVTPNMVGGMGDAVLPNGDATGSGDVPAGSGKAKKKKKLKNIEDFLQEQKQLKSFKPEQGKGEALGEGEYENGSPVSPEQEMEHRANAHRVAKNVIAFDTFSKR